MIIDDEELLFFASSAGSPLASFCSKVLCRVPWSYFELAWREARPIKEGPRVYRADLAHIHEAAGNEKNTW